MAVDFSRILKELLGYRATGWWMQFFLGGGSGGLIVQGGVHSGWVDRREGGST